MMISTQVFDTARGVPAARIAVELDYFITGQGWKEVGHGVTNSEGRITEFGEPPAPGIYRMMFDIDAYQMDAFFPSISVTFEVRDPAAQYHIPLLISPYGYSTHRGMR